MDVSVPEVALVILSAAIAVFLARRCQRPWLHAIPVQVAIIAVFTPADPLSTLLIATPCCVLYALGVLKSGSQPQPAA